MDKRRKKSSQKQFIQTMIITGVLGLTIMMIVMLYMIKLFGGKKAVIVQEPLTTIVGNKSKDDVESESIKGVIHDMGAKRKNIKIWDIQEKQYTKLNIKEKAQITDSYGKPMSIQEVELGEIVEITYESKKKEVLTLQKSAKAWTKSGVSAIDMSTKDKTIKIGNMKYNYTTDIVVINDEQGKITIGEINNLDTLKIKGIDDTIWSIQVVQAAGYLQLSNIPTTKGTIEIGNNTIYRLEEVEEFIPLAGGQHKIVIRMEGYLPFVKNINISTNQVQELDLKEVASTEANLKIRVVNADVDYHVKIDSKTYKKDESITVKPGVYTLKVIAEGFKTIEMEIQLEEGSRRINLTLQPQDGTVTPETGNQNSGQGSTTPQSPIPTNPIPNVTPNPIPNPIPNPVPNPIPDKPKPEPPAQEIKTVQIIIETDPTDAKVFVSGVYKGATPALTGLKPGEYSISIEKEGYTSLYSTIIIDASNAQKGFLYTLQKE